MLDKEEMFVPVNTWLSSPVPRARQLAGGSGGRTPLKKVQRVVDEVVEPVINNIAM